MSKTDCVPMDLEVESGQRLRRLARGAALLWLALAPLVALYAVNFVDFTILREELQQPLQPHHGASLLAYGIALGLTVLPVLVLAISLVVRPGNFSFTGSLLIAVLVGVTAVSGLSYGSRMPLPSLVLSMGSAVIAVLSAIGWSRTRPSGEVVFMPPPTHQA